MAGEGHMLAMIQRIKENKALRKSRRDKFKSKQDLYTTGMNETLTFKEVSKEELAKIRKKNRAKIKQQELNQFLRFVAIFAGIGLLAFLFF